MNKAISFGAGVNSIAMTIMLFKRGEIYPVVFADTMAEHPETYCYMDYFEKEFMSKYGQKIIRLSYTTHPECYSNYNSKTLEEYCIEKQLVPFVTSKRYCSKGWKIEPFNKYLKQIANKKTKMVKVQIGFAYDEKHRAKKIQNNLVKIEEYPLIERGIGRKACVDIIKSEDLSVPRKSRCFFCPYQDKDAWERLYNEYPDLFNRAEFLEINATNKKGIKTTLLPSGVSLNDLRYGYANQIDAFPDWDFEELEPCMCKL